MTVLHRIAGPGVTGIHHQTGIPAGTVMTWLMRGAEVLAGHPTACGTYGTGPVLQPGSRSERQSGYLEVP